MAASRLPRVGDIIIVHDPDAADCPRKAAIVESDPIEDGSFRVVIFNWAYGKEGATTRGIQYVERYGQRWEFKDGGA